MADFLFDWLGLDHRNKTVFHSTQESKQNKQEVSRAVILPLKLVFFALRSNTIGRNLGMKSSVTAILILQYLT